jgi:chromosome segregation ATPase
MKESGYNRAERKLVMESLKENSLRQLGNAALQLEVVDTKQSSRRAEYQQGTDRALSLQKRSEQLKSTLLENSERRSSADAKIQQLKELERDWKALEKERNNGTDSTLLPELDFRGYEAIGDLLGDIENQKMRLKHLIAERDKIEKAIDDTNSHIEKTKKENTSVFHRLAPRSAQLEAQRDEIQRKIRSMVRDINNGK